MAEPIVTLPALSSDEMAAAMQDGAVLLDLRELVPYAEAHLPGAIFIPCNPRTLPKQVAAVAPAGGHFVLIGDEERTGLAAAWLVANGAQNVLGRLEEGIEGWAASGKPLANLKRTNVADLHRRWSTQRESFDLVDVRERFEWKLGYIEGSRLVSFDVLAHNIDSFPKGRYLVFICEEGLRSATAASLFSSHSYERVETADGGFGAWFKAGFPFVE